MESTLAVPPNNFYHWLEAASWPLLAASEIAPFIARPKEVSNRQFGNMAERSML